MAPLHGNWVDLVVLVFLAVYGWEGTKRGFLVLIGEMVSFVASFLLALRFYPLAAQFLINNFSLSHGLANALGFMTVAVLAEMITAYLLTIGYRKLPGKFFTSNVNRALGILPALFDGLILTAFILTVLVSLPLSGSLKADILASKIGEKLVSQTRDLEKSLNEVFGGAVSETLSFLTVPTGGSQNVDLHFRTKEYTVDEKAEEQMLILVNEERTDRGLPALKLDLRLRDLARAHSKDMFSRGYFSHMDPDGHDPFDRMRAAGITYAAAGENLAYAPSVTIAHEGLMNSAGHRANILSSDFGRVGIGVIDGGVYGKMFTQEFTD